MYGRIILTGRTPFRIEYSQSFIKNGVSSYESPYERLYGEPVAQYDRYENYYNLDFQEYKKERLIRQYKFFDNYKKQAPSRLLVNLAF